MTSGCWHPEDDFRFVPCQPASFLPANARITFRFLQRNAAI
jgi:hypothetical protein